MGRSGRSKTAQQWASALAGLVQGVSHGMQFGMTLNARDAEYARDEKFRQDQLAETVKERESRDRDRDAALDEKKREFNERQKALRGRGGSSDFVRFALGLTDAKSMAEAHLSKGRIAAIQKYHDLREKGASEEEAAAEMGITPGEQELPATSATAMALFPTKKADPATGMVKVSRDEYIKAYQGLASGKMPIDPHISEAIQKERGEFFQSGFGHSGLNAAYLHDKWNEWQALKTGVDSSAAPSSRPAPAESRPASRPAGGGQLPGPQAQPQNRAAAIAASSTDAMSRYLSPDPQEAIAGWQEVVTTIDPMAPAPMWIPGIERILPSLAGLGGGTMGGAVAGQMQPEHPADRFTGFRPNPGAAMGGRVGQKSGEMFAPPSVSRPANPAKTLEAAGVYKPGRQ